MSRDMNYYLSKLSWPRGKYNGAKISGFRISLQIHVLTWRFNPVLRWNFGEPVASWLMFTIRFKPEYKQL
jgi:hypothetical protein